MDELFKVNKEFYLFDVLTDETRIQKKKKQLPCKFIYYKGNEKADLERWLRKCRIMLIGINNRMIESRTLLSII